MTIIDLETGENAAFEMATAMPEITASNDTQKMGGCMTYANRYLLMNVYDIVDNNLDFDAQKPAQKNQNKPQNNNNQKSDDNNKPWLNEDMPAFLKAKGAISSGTKTIADVRKVYKVSKKIESLLTSNGQQNNEPDNEGLPF